MPWPKKGKSKLFSDLPLLSDRKFLDKALIYVSKENTPKSLENISEYVFNDWKSPELDAYLKGILLELLSDGYIEEKSIGNDPFKKKIYSITGKGRKFCNKPWSWLKNSPYLFDKISKGAERLFTKYLPIILSIISLIISLLAYLKTKK